MESLFNYVTVIILSFPVPEFRIERSRNRDCGYQCQYNWELAQSESQPSFTEYYSPIQEGIRNLI